MHIINKPTFSVFTILFLASAPVVADQADDFDPDHIMVRAEYIHSMDTPNHLVFWSVLRSIQRRDSEDHDRTVQIIENRFETDEREDAETILANMLATAESIRSERLDVRNRIFCERARAQKKDVIYQRMDEIDDERAAATRRHYLSFLSGLSATEEVYLLRWLNETKKTYSYRSGSHKSMYEGTGTDMIAYVNQACAKWGQTR